MSALEQLKGVERNPAQEIFKISPDVVEQFIGKLLVVMGADPSDIQNIEVTQDKKRLRVFASVDDESGIFCGQHQRTSGLALLGSGATGDEYELTQQAKVALQEFGYFYKDDDQRANYMVAITEYKKGIEIEFNAEVTMAIITDSDFSDQYFIVDAVEEPVKRKKYNSHKFKGKKKTVVFARVQRSFLGDDQGFQPSQVRDWKSGYEVDEEDE